jgi:acyl-CoA thioesterase FadM
MQVGQALLARVTVARLSGRRAVFETDCFQLASGAVVVDGEAVALMS